MKMLYDYFTPLARLSTLGQPRIGNTICQGSCRNALLVRYAHGRQQALKQLHPIRAA